jgi:hypothetical protein
MIPIRSAAPMVLALSALVASSLACNLPSTGQALPLPAPIEPTATFVSEEQAPAEPAPPPEEVLIVAHQEPHFQIYTLEGEVEATWPADGTDWARPNTVQVVGEAIYHVYQSGPEQGSVVRRVTAEGVEDLEFTRSQDIGSLCFAVTDDGSRIAWAGTTWTADGPKSQLWMADITGANQVLVAETRADDEISEWFVLEPVEWLEDGDLVYAWQVTGIGGYILFFGWSSLYRYAPSTGSTTPIVPATGEVGAPCWSDMTSDGAFAIGACAPSAGVEELEAATGLATQLPMFPEQGQAGAGAFSPSGSVLAYAIARGDATNEAGQVVFRSERGSQPTSVASVATGYFQRLIWIDDQRMAVGVWAEDAASVEVLGTDGSRRPVGGGRLVGLMRRPGQGSGVGLEDQLRRGELQLADLTATGEIAAPGVNVLLSNPGPTNVETYIPCGTIFAPSGGDAQELMVVQEARGTVPAGGEATLTPFVICIEADASIPDVGAAYAFSSKADGKLAELATCVCQQDLTASANPLDSMGVQFAGWMVSEGSPFQELLESGEGGAIGDLLGSDVGEALAGVFELIEGPAMDWLDRCGIQP